MTTPAFTRFPLLMTMTDKQILVIGGGTVASRKVEALLPFAPKITLIAPKVTPAIENWHRTQQIDWVDNLYDEQFITESVHYIIIATDDRNINQAATRYAKQLNIPVNVADSPEDCDFHMPATILNADQQIMISISSNGSTPSTSKKVRQRLQEWIDAGGLNDL